MICRWFCSGQTRLLFLVCFLLVASLVGCTGLQERENLPPRKEPLQKPVFEGDAGQSLLRSAVYLRNQGMQGAFDACENAITPGSHLASAINLMGVIQWKMDDHDEARKTWETAHAEEPLLAAPLFNLGGYYLSKLEYATAEDFFRRALEVDPALAAARLNLSVAEYKLGRRDKAINAWKMLKGIPGLEDASINLFRVTGDRKYLASVVQRIEAFSRGGLVWRHPVMMDSYLSRFVDQARKTSTYLLLEGEALIQLGNLESARVSLLRALDFPDASPEAHYLLGRLYLEAGRDESALEEFRKSLTKGFADPKLFLGLAELYKKQNDWVAAEALLRGGLKTVRDESMLYGVLGEVLLQLNKREEALEYLKLAAAENPRDFQSRILLGRFYLEEGEWKKAEHEFEIVLQVNGQSAYSWFLLGKARLSMDDGKGAESAFRKALALEPENASFQESLGDTLLLLGRFDEARVVFKNILEMRPESKSARSKLKRAYDKLALDLEEEGRRALERGELSVAVEYFESALLSEPEKESLKNVLARTAGALGMRLLREENPAGAEKYLRKAVTAAPKMKEFQFGYIQALLQLSDFPAALQALSLLRKSNPGDAQAWELTADTLWSRGQYQESIPFLDEAVRLSRKKESIREKRNTRFKLLEESLWIERAKEGSLLFRAQGEVSEYRQFGYEIPISEPERIPIFGSAFFISPEGHCITSYRSAVSGELRKSLNAAPLSVFYNATIPTLVLRSGQKNSTKVPALLLASDRGRDLALLKLSFMPEKGALGFLPFGAGAQVKETSVVYALGYPLTEGQKAEGAYGPAITIGRGRIVSHQKIGEKMGTPIEIFRADMQVQGSNAGGPVVNEEGRVVGMISLGLAGALDEPSGATCVITIEEIKKFLAEKGFEELIPKVPE